jgi:hypothetical protein
MAWTGDIGLWTLVMRLCVCVCVCVSHAVGNYRLTELPPDPVPSTSQLVLPSPISRQPLQFPTTHATRRAQRHPQQIRTGSQCRSSCWLRGTLIVVQTKDKLLALKKTDTSLRVTTALNNVTCSSNTALTLY